MHKCDNQIIVRQEMKSVYYMALRPWAKQVT